VERGGSQLRSARFAGLTAGITLCITSTAVAADVSVRVEGAADTVVPRTQVSTSPGVVNKDGVPGRDCTGTSAAGALERATGGDWDGTWYDSFASYTVDRVKAETHDFSSGSYWAFWVNGKAASTGICGAELSSGDEVLFFPDCGTPDCAGPLDLDVPARVSTGAPFRVTVNELLDGGANVQPAAGATVSVGAATYSTGAAGTVEVPGRSDVVAIRATKPGRIRSATESVCVTNGVDGRCGTTLDDSAPAVTIQTPRHGRVPYRRGPRELRGLVGADPSGLRHVKLRLTRTHAGRCSVYGSRAEHFRRVRCGEGWWFSIGSSEKWSYLLPERLPRGRYVLQAVAIDGSGNRDALQTGRNRVRFTVR